MIVREARGSRNLFFSGVSQLPVPAKPGAIAESAADPGAVVKSRAGDHLDIRLRDMQLRVFLQRLLMRGGLRFQPRVVQRVPRSAILGDGGRSGVCDGRAVLGGIHHGLRPSTMSAGLHGQQHGTILGW